MHNGKFVILRKIQRNTMIPKKLFTKHKMRIDWKESYKKFKKEHDDMYSFLKILFVLFAVCIFIYLISEFGKVITIILACIGLVALLVGLVTFFYELIKGIKDSIVKK